MFPHERMYSLQSSSFYSKKKKKRKIITNTSLKWFANVSDLNVTQKLPLKRLFN